jgi:hypothetical protein
MTNTNCLAGIKCPACGNEDSFRIAATAVFTVTDDGTDDYTAVEWDDDSDAECTECQRRGNVKDFRNSASEESYFRGPSGTRYGYAEIADRIRREAPHTLGKHISVQLDAIGLRDEMMNGTTPCALPFTFADAAGMADAERQRQAAAKLLDACKLLDRAYREGEENGGSISWEALDDAWVISRTAIADAEAAGIVPEPAAPRLLASLEVILPYAEAERTSLSEAWRRDRDRAVNVELHACDLALGNAWAAIAEAKAIGVVTNPAEIDIHALLAARRQIASVWSVEDVQEVRPDLTKDQSWEVLQQAKDQHNADIGISWDVLQMHAAELFGSAPKTDEAEEA